MTLVTTGGAFVLVHANGGFQRRIEHLFEASIADTSGHRSLKIRKEHNHDRILE